MKKCILHAWKRNKLQKTYFSCDHPDCSTKKPKQDLIGKRALCVVCSRPFILTQDMLRRAIPHCGCRGKGKELDLAASVSKEVQGVEALNTSSQVRQFPIDEDQSKFDPITTALKASGFPIELIAFNENDEREWDVREIVQRLACFLKDRWKDTPPTIMYKSKTKGLVLFTAESTRPEFLRLSDVMADLVRFPEFIESRFSSGDKSRKGFGGWRAVKKLSKPSARPGTNFQREYQMDLAASLPLAAAFREILELRDDRYYWAVEWKVVFERCAEDLYKLLVNKSKSIKSVRDLGSDTVYWTQASVIVLRAKMEILQERGPGYSNSPEIVKGEVAISAREPEIKEKSLAKAMSNEEKLLSKQILKEDKMFDKVVEGLIKMGMSREKAEKKSRIAREAYDDMSRAESEAAKRADAERCGE